MIYAYIRWLFCIALCCIFSESVAQSIVLQGQLVNLDKQGVPFAHISINNGEQGTVSDIDGFFNINISVNIKTVSFSCIGYESFVYEVKKPEDLNPLKRFLTIRLKEREGKVEEIVVDAGENPANIIIRKASQQRNRHNPERLKSFRYKSYNKFFLTLGEVSDSLKGDNADSLTLKKARYFDGHHLFLSESISERKFLSPNYNKELVVANRVSGFNNPSFAALATDFQPFSFHKNHIKVLDEHYLNPISSGSTEKYFFFIEDSTFNQKDTTYIISFTPKQDKNFRGLKGLLYINTDGYALQAVFAESLPQESDLVYFKLRQRYERVEGRWFPSQLHADITFKELQIANRPYMASMRGYLREIDVSPGLKLKDFDHNSLEILPSASQQEDLFWNQYRPESLNRIEQETYLVIDSLGKSFDFDRIMAFSEAMSFGYWRVGKVDLDVINAMSFNNYEGTCLQIGGQSNALFHPDIRLGGYLAYGTRDGNFKYGLNAAYQFLPRFAAEVGLSWQEDVREPGEYDFTLSQVNVLQGSGYRAFLTERMDKIKKLRSYLRFRPVPNTLIEFSLHNEDVSPAYDYFFQPNNEESLNFFTNTAFGLRFHYAFGERYMTVKGRQALVELESPMFGINYQKGFRDMLNGDFDYERIEAFVEYHHRSKRLGLTALRLEAGLVNGEVPYSLLYNGRGSFASNFPFVAKGYFQTMGIYEFLNRRFVNIFLTHNFGRLLYKSPLKWFQPELIVAQNIGYGDLANVSQHSLIEFSTMERGYYESGIIIDKVLRTKLLKMSYLDLGIGGFYRYGVYGKSTFNENFALRLSLGVSF